MRPPEQLDVLSDAGVVDAGGRGLLVLLDALSKTVSGHAPARKEYVPAPPDVEITVGAARTAVRGDVPTERL